MAGTYSDTGNIIAGRNIYAADVKGPIDELDDALAALVAGTIPLTNAEITNQLRFGTPVTATLMSDGLVPTKTLLNVSAESGTSDDLKYITQTLKPMAIVIRATSGHTITVKHNAAGGNIKLPSEQDFVLSNVNQSIMLITDGSTGWYGLGSANPASSLSLTDLLDVNATSPVNTDIIRWDSGTNRWINSIVPLNYVEKYISPANWSTTSTSWVDLQTTLMSASITLKGTKALAIFASSVRNSVVGADCLFDFALDGTRIGSAYGTAIMHAPVASYMFPFVMSAIINTTAGAHTIKVQWKTSAGELRVGLNLAAATLFVMELG